MREKSKLQTHKCRNANILTVITLGMCFIKQLGSMNGKANTNVLCIYVISELMKNKKGGGEFSKWDGEILLRDYVWVGIGGFPRTGLFSVAASYVFAFTAT